MAEEPADAETQRSEQFNRFLFLVSRLNELVVAEVKSFLTNDASKTKPIPGPVPIPEATRTHENLSVWWYFQTFASRLKESGSLPLWATRHSVVGAS
jgi:hypothetical protein